MWAIVVTLSTILAVMAMVLETIPALRDIPEETQLILDSGNVTENHVYFFMMNTAETLSLVYIEF